MKTLYVTPRQAASQSIGQAQDRSHTHPKNVVFDMGGVLMEWNPLKLASCVAQTEEDAELLAQAVFGGRAWQLQDAGAVSADTVAWTAARELPERLAAQAEYLANHWYEHRTMLPEIGDLIRELKEHGYGIYLLSNAGTQFNEYRDSLPAVECFDGMVVSAFEHVVKPDAALFRILLGRYDLDPRTCLFVDDVEENVIGAERVGMQGYTYDGNVARLRDLLLVNA